MTGFRSNAACSAALCAALLLTATACGSSPSGPTSAQAGTYLKSDIGVAVKWYTHLGRDKPTFTVSSDASKDVPCGKGRARRTYTTSQRRTGKGVTDVQYMFNEVQLMGSFLSKIKESRYEEDLKANNAQGPTTVSDKQISSRHHAETTIVGKAVSGAFVITLEGETDCLRTS